MTISGNATEPDTYEKGDMVTATARPARGFRLTGWTVDGRRLPQTGNTVSIMVTGDGPVVAEFS
ncbi:hypothetical protein GT034_02555 [Streptomyces sp. SID2563]|uniref:InlB B-repeat-containing protein n=1 Tax=Streptomyces sp. SID2563 TaxID=2690255 RepID=UPI00136FF9EC|nr:hypothetical protein [Streptomyces sp. SID2563]